MSSVDFFCKFGTPCHSPIKLTQTFNNYVFLQQASMFVEKNQMKRLGLSSVPTTASFFGDQAKMDMRKNSRTRLAEFFRKIEKKAGVYFFFDATR